MTVAFTVFAFVFSAVFFVIDIALIRLARRRKNRAGVWVGGAAAFFALSGIVINGLVLTALPA